MVFRIELFRPKNISTRNINPMGTTLGLIVERLEDKQYPTFTFILSQDMRVIWMIHEVGFVV